MTAQRAFVRSFDALPAIVDFTAESFASEGIDPSLRPVVDLALEELFTNMVKYSNTSNAEVRIEVTGVADGVEISLTDFDVEPFDVTRAPDVDTTLPIEARRPGGLGLHLIRRMLDSIDYEYKKDGRQSRITFRKTRSEAPDRQGAGRTGGK
jgi:anti-sigma regulatory factor (Ser/Thr protein kinase)